MIRIGWVQVGLQNDSYEARRLSGWLEVGEKRWGCYGAKKNKRRNGPQP